MSKTSVLVISGGLSDEREVSLRSGEAVSRSLEVAGYTVTTLDYAGHLPTKTVQAADVIFPILHGAGGEDGVIQSQLERLGRPYVGSAVAASKLCFNKWTYKQLLQAHSLPVPAGELLNFTDYTASALYQHPFVLKPYDGGSSVDTIIVRTTGHYQPDQISDMFSRHRQMLLEELIVGQEITIGVLGNQALPVIEIIPPDQGEFDYSNKYNGLTQELCPPQHIAVAIQDQARQLALQIHQLTDCRDFSRTDMIVRPDGQLFVLETNTSPGMTDQSLLPKAAAQAGLDFPALVDQLVQLALNH